MAILDAYKIHPAVYAATEDELIAAGYADTERWRIPADWQRIAHLRAKVAKEEAERYEEEMLRKIPYGFRTASQRNRYQVLKRKRLEREASA